MILCVLRTKCNLPLLTKLQTRSKNCCHKINNRALQDQADDEITAQMRKQKSETIKEMASVISDMFTLSKSKTKDLSAPKPPAIPVSLQALQPVQKTDNYGSPISQDICDALSQSWHRVFHK